MFLLMNMNIVYQYFPKLQYAVWKQSLDPVEISSVDDYNHAINKHTFQKSNMDNRSVLAVPF